MTDVISKEELSKNLRQVKSRLSDAIKKADREISEVKLIAVSKKKPYPALEHCFDLGQDYFAENYVKEALDKFSKLKNKASKENKFLETHFIGHLQSNKAKIATELFDVIQTIDSIKLAEKIANASAKISKQQRILIQVNISNEDSKSGVSLKELPHLIDFVLTAKNELKLTGLMAIGSSLKANPKANKKGEFESLAYVLRRENKRVSSVSSGINFGELSMGMSEDLEEALLYGSTMVRVGSAIFGARI